MDYILWLEIAVFIILMLLSGFFSSSETALFSLSQLQLEQMRRDKHPRIEAIQRMLSQPRRLIITILIGNELVNVAASALSAVVIIKILGAESKWINLFIMIPLLLVMGEITPKSLAMQHNIAFASVESRLIEIFALFIKPLRAAVRYVSDRIITLLIGKDRSRGNIITEDMVRTLAHEAVGSGALDSIEAQFIDHIFDFGNKTLADIMTPRSSIFFLPLEMPLQQMVTELCRERHTKIPVYLDRRDNVVGILHARDLLGVDLNRRAGTTENLKELLRKPYFIPESKTAVALFHVFRERKISIALTVDEFGGVTGLVTMEDLLECIFGDIRSACDAHIETRIMNLEDGRYAVDGRITVEKFNREMGAALSEKKAETIGGLLLHHHGELPQKGDTIDLDEWLFTVGDVGDNRIKTVEFELKETTNEFKGQDSAKGAAEPDSETKGKPAASAKMPAPGKRAPGEGK